MFSDTQSTTNCFQLAVHEALTLTRVQGGILHCLRGLLWLSSPESGDVILQAGQHWRLVAQDEVVVSALRAGSAAILRPVAGPAPEFSARHWLERLCRWQFPALAQFPATVIR